MEADDCYIGEDQQYVKCPASFVNRTETEFMQQRCHNRQETVNKQFKQWDVLKQRYRHNITAHGEDFRAFVVSTQMIINNNESLFKYGYFHPPFHNNDDDSDISYDTDAK